MRCVCRKDRRNGLCHEDRDSIYAVSIGDVDADQDLVGSLGAMAASEAIIRAVNSAESAYGIPSASDLK